LRYPHGRLQHRQTERTDGAIDAFGQHELSCRAIEPRINWLGWRSGSGEPQAYFTSFIQKLVPTNDLGNTDGRGHEIDIRDEGSLQQAE
jgi:hypothetical protein